MLRARDALQRIAFRFLAVYFVLYSLPFPLDLLPGAGLSVDRWWFGMWAKLVPPLGRRLLGRPIAMGTAGSSDMTFHYLQILCFLAIAAVAAAVWTLLDRQRRLETRLDRYVRTYLRFALAAAMLSYGIQKVIPAQFPPLSLDRLV